MYTLILYVNDIPYVIYRTQAMVLDSKDDELWNETVSVVLIITTPLVIIYLNQISYRKYAMVTVTMRIITTAVMNKR